MDKTEDRHQSEAPNRPEAGAGPTRGFDASRYLTKLNGRDYLEVKWRLLWLRTEHPEAAVTTELMRLEDGLALFKAQVSIPGSGAATGWGSETENDFGDYIEKAETKALGRALAALGYGTQFCEDFDFHTKDSGKVVDSPVARPQEAQPGALRGGRSAAPATASQVRAIYAIGRADWGLSEAELNERCQRDYGYPPEALSKEQASALITQLKRGPEPGEKSRP